MKTTTAEVAENFGQFADKAMTEPVTITQHGRDHLVLLSAEEYARLKQGDRRAWRTGEAPPEIVEAVRDARMDRRHDSLDKLLEEPKP